MRLTFLSTILIETFLYLEKWGKAEAEIYQKKGEENKLI